MNNVRATSLTPTGRQILRMACLMAALAVVSLEICPSSCHARADEPAAKSVRLIIDYGDGVEKHFTRLAWKPKMTVLDAVEQATGGKHGIKVKYRGRGETAFLMKIDDLQNEAGGRGSRSWLFSVNGKPAAKSFGIYELNQGDRIVWKFGPYEPKP